VSFEWSRETLWSSERLFILVAVYGDCAARQPAIDGVRGAATKPTRRCPGGIGSVSVDSHRGPRAADQRQPGRAATVPGRCVPRRLRPVSRRPSGRGTVAVQDRQSRDDASERLQAATAGARDVIEQRAATLRRLARGRRGATYRRATALYRYCECAIAIIRPVRPYRSVS